MNSTQRSIKSRMSASVLGLSLCFGVTQLHAQFTNGNLVVLQAGDGISTLASTGNQIILKEFSTSGTPTYSLAIPSTTVSGNALVTSGSATSEGLITRSANKNYLVFPGYANTFTASVSGATGTNVPRGLGQVDATGSYTRVATSTTFYTGNNIRGAASDGTGNYWASGANQGTNYFGTASTATLVQSTVSNSRSIAIYNNQLYLSTGSATRGIYMIGNGLPVSSATATLAIATGTASSPYQFCFNTAGDVCYIADDAAISLNGGIQKWTYNGTTWVNAYTFATSTSTAVTVGARGLSVDFSGANPVIYATSAEGSANRLFSVVDGGSVGTSTITTLATAGTNTIFRGLAFSPISCNSPSITAISAGGAICAGQALNLSVSAAGSAPLTYSWTGSGSFSSSASGSPTVAGASSSNYSVSVSNACGTATSVVTATVNALPTVVANTSMATLCEGQSTSLSGSGASTYTWSSGVSNGATFTPTVTNTYTVTGTDVNNCVNSATVTITVNTLPVISTSNATVCAGQSGTITATGAGTYTWNTTATTASISDNPPVSTTYTVTGTDANGCNGSATANIIVNTLPAVSSTSATVCSGGTATITASGASTYTWSNSVNTTSIVVSPASTTVYTVSGTDLNGCVNSASGSVNITSSPSITVNSATVCAGSAATITASGVSTYTWSSGENTASISPSPSSTTVYTVSGQAAGCVVIATNTTTVTVNTLPSVSVTPVSGPFCVNSPTVTLSGSPSGGTFSGAGLTGNIFDPSAAGAGTYTLTYTYTNSNSCTNTASETVTVNTLPTVSVSPVSSVPLCSNGSTVALSGSPAGGTFSGTGVSGNNFSPATAGVGTFTVSYLYTNANSCSNSSAATVTVTTCTGIEGHQSPAALTVYPNPAKDVLHVQFSATSAAAVVEVFDATGSLVYSTETNESSITINTSSLNRGLYIIRLKSSASQSTSRFIKE